MPDWPQYYGRISAFHICAPNARRKSSRILPSSSVKPMTMHCSADSARSSRGRGGEHVTDWAALAQDLASSQRGKESPTTVIDWLLDADPSIRWQVMRDLTRGPA